MGGISVAAGGKAVLVPGTGVMVEGGGDGGGERSSPESELSAVSARNQVSVCVGGGVCSGARVNSGEGVLKENNSSVV